MAIANPSVKCRSFPGRKAFDILTGRIPCQGDPVLIGYANYNMMKQLDQKLDKVLQQAAVIKLEKEDPELFVAPGHSQCCVTQPCTSRCCAPKRATKHTPKHTSKSAKGKQLEPCRTRHKEPSFDGNRGPNKGSCSGSMGAKLLRDGSQARSRRRGMQALGFLLHRAGLRQQELTAP